MRNWDEVRRRPPPHRRRQSASITYTGEVPDPLLSIPVLEVELNADGSVRQIKVLRAAAQAKDTTQIAIDAVHRAAPFGDVSRLPKPWKFSEAFLFNDRPHASSRERWTSGVLSSARANHGRGTIGACSSSCRRFSLGRASSRFR